MFDVINAHFTVQTLKERKNLKQQQQQLYQRDTTDSTRTRGPEFISRTESEGLTLISVIGGKDRTLKIFIYENILFTHVDIYLI